jgi:hypothetical protein
MSPGVKRHEVKAGGYHCNARGRVDERLGVGKFRICHTLLYTCGVFVRTAIAVGQRVRTLPAPPPCLLCSSPPVLCRTVRSARHCLLHRTTSSHPSVDAELDPNCKSDCCMRGLCVLGVIRADLASSAVERRVHSRLLCEPPGPSTHTRCPVSSTHHTDRPTMASPQARDNAARRDRLDGDSTSNGECVRVLYEQWQQQSSCGKERAEPTQRVFAPSPPSPPLPPSPPARPPRHTPHGPPLPPPPWPSNKPPHPPAEDSLVSPSLSLSIISLKPCLEMEGALAFFRREVVGTLKRQSAVMSMLPPRRPRNQRTMTPAASAHQ